uniref:NADH-ubiquinone oxidoreductase chain 6 n=1 Tax=Magelona mirabilis TaxID=46598 RepID=A0A0S2N0E9_9ANNE|nr:NADH dehydrogenase subunit 6 [Magelona mirabilis]ALO81679.1 NADH dehydrogenase subunit 6 [Magelona mirabilis]
MSLLFFLSLSVSLAMSAPIMTQPILLGLTLLILTLTSAVLVAYSVSSWFGYIVFIIYIGGVLVMFAYVAALTPNLLFSAARPFKYTTTILIGFVTLTLFLPSMPTSTNNNNWSTPTHLDLMGAQIYSASNSLILVALGLVLLLALIVVVKICNYSSGPLRPFN